MSLQIWLPLTQGTEINNQGLSDATFNTSGAISLVTTDGLGSCYSGNGSGYIVSNKKINLGNNQSMFCWVKPTIFNSSSSLTGICGQHRYMTMTGMGLTLIRVTDSTGYLSVNTGTGNGRTYKTYQGSTLLNANNWYHIGYTYDGNVIKLYVNGNLDGSFTVGKLACKDDYFQCFAWSFDSTNDTTNKVYSGYYLNGKLNDVRAYNHTLSTKEIKELAKGLMIHYPFRDPYCGETYSTELLISPSKKIKDVSNVGWDTLLHKDAIEVDNWSIGYNSGVKVPTIGWHAHWKMINDIPTIVFPKLNYQYTAQDAQVTHNRWLGISTKSSTIDIFTSSNSGHYEISFEAKADVPGRIISCGFHYNNGSGQDFWDGLAYAEDIPTTEWKRYTFSWNGYSRTHTISSGYGRFYFYGHNGSDGVAYVRNITIVAPGNRNECHYTDAKEKDLIYYDSSGLGYHINNTENGIIAPTNESNRIYAGTYTNRPSDIALTKHSGGYFRTPLSLHIPTNSTISLFLERGNYTGHFIDWRGKTSSGTEYGIQPIYIRSPGQIQYWTSTLGDSNYFSYNIDEYMYYHICLVATSTQVHLYINGEYQESKANATPIADPCPLTLFARRDDTNITGGSIGDFRVYGTALSVEDVKHLYQEISIDKHENAFAKEVGMKDQIYDMED